MKLLGRILIVLLALGSSLTARADLFTFAFSGGGQTAAGSLNANATGTAGQFLITSISGTLTGATINALLPPGSFGGNDNLLFQSGTNFLPDGAGFSFSLTNGTLANVFTFAGAPFTGQQFVALSNGTLAQMTSFQVTQVPVPEPSSWMLLATGAFGLMRAARRRLAA